MYRKFKPGETVTAETLEGLNACEEGMHDFKELFPEGLELSLEGTHKLVAADPSMMVDASTMAYRILIAYNVEAARSWAAIELAAWRDYAFSNNERYVEEAYGPFFRALELLVKEDDYV